MSYSLDDLRHRLSRLDSHVEQARSVHRAAMEAAAHAQADVQVAQQRRDGAAAFVAELEAEAAEISPATDAQTRQPPAEPQLQPVVVGVGAVGNIVPVGNTELVRSILGLHPEGIDIREVQRVAVQRGFDLDGEQVRSAVAYLRRRGYAENVRRGVWRLVALPIGEDGWPRLDGAVQTSFTSAATEVRAE